MARSRVLRLVRLIVPVSILTAVLWTRDWAALRALVVRADYRLLLAALAIHLVAVFVQGWRWHVLLRSDGGDWSFARLQWVHATAPFFDLFAPGKLGSDAYRVAGMRRPGRNAHTISSIVALRVHGFAAAVVCSAAAGGAVLGARHGWVFVVVSLSTLVLLAGLAMVGIHAFGSAGADYLRSKGGLRESIGVHLNRAIEAFNRILSHRRVMLVSCALVVVFMLAVAGVYAAAGRAFHMPLRYVSYLAAVPIFLVASVLPITIQGRGITEVLAIALWAGGASGATSEQVVLTCLAVYAVQMVQALLGGAAWAVGRGMANCE